MGITTCYELSRASGEEQSELLQLQQSGASRDALAERIRKKKRADTSAVRAKRIMCPLSSGISIAVSGKGLTLDDLIEALGDAQKEAKKAREQGLDAKTFGAVMKDKSRKG